MRVGVCKVVFQHAALKIKKELITQVYKAFQIVLYLKVLQCLRRQLFF